MTPDEEVVEEASAEEAEEVVIAEASAEEEEEVIVAAEAIVAEEVSSPASEAGQKSLSYVHLPRNGQEIQQMQTKRRA